MNINRLNEVKTELHATLEANGIVPTIDAAAIRITSLEWQIARMQGQLSELRTENSWIKNPDRMGS